MNSLSKLQSEFLDAIYGTDGYVSQFEDHLENIEYCQNIDIYRNNLYYGLSDNLASKFPICQELLGKDYFRNISEEFIHKTPLSAGTSNSFGASFAQFLARVLAGTQYNFVAEIAQIEWAKFCAEISENCENLDFNQIADCLRGNDKSEIDGIKLHPSFSIIWAKTNSLELYIAHLNHDIGHCTLKEIPLCIGVWRNIDFDPCFKILSQFEAALIAKMQSGQSITAALEDVLTQTESEKDAQAQFISLSNNGVFARLAP